jgi:hypothetical protein
VLPEVGITGPGSQMAPSQDWVEASWTEVVKLLARLAVMGKGRASRTAILANLPAENLLNVMVSLFLPASWLAFSGCFSSHQTLAAFMENLKLLDSLFSTGKSP